MIQVRYDREHLDLRVSGHAGSDQKGRDVVCAAVSILVYTLAHDVEILKDRGDAQEVTMILRPGQARIRCTPRQAERVRLVYDSIFTGFRLLAKSYAQYITIRG